MSEKDAQHVTSPSDQVESGKSTDLAPVDASALPPKEVGGRAGPEPTRFGDWEKNGRCIDF